MTRRSTLRASSVDPAPGYRIYAKATQSNCLGGRASQSGWRRCTGRRSQIARIQFGKCELAFNIAEGDVAARHPFRPQVLVRCLNRIQHVDHAFDGILDPAPRCGADLMKPAMAITSRPRPPCQSPPIDGTA